MNPVERAAEWLERKLAYRPRDPALFAAAMRHRSAGRAHNERLEFLGDAIVNLFVAEYLYQHFGDTDEGALSRLRARLVSGAALARRAAELELGDSLELGPGELKTGGFRRESILADALEAVCGALYLDAGHERSRELILGLLEPALRALGDESDAKDAKTRLQEWLQARGMALPNYSVEQVSGEAHEQEFVMSCVVETLQLRATGRGTSRRRAEQLAAEALLARLSA